MDHKTEIPLDPGSAKVVIFYPHSDGERLVTISWTEGMDHFTSQVGDDPPINDEVFDADNIYTTVAHMAGVLDEWRDNNEPPATRGAV